MNDVLKKNASNDTLKVMKENALLLEKNQKMQSTLELNAHVIATNEAKYLARLNGLESEKQTILAQLQHAKEVNQGNEGTALQLATTVSIEKAKLKSEIKALQHQILSETVIRKEELTCVVNEKDSKLEEMMELKTQLQQAESKIAQNTELFEAEKQRVIVLEQSKAQISSAESRIAFSTEKRKFKEEISSLNIKINKIEAETTDLKSAYSRLEIKLLETESVAKNDSIQMEERIVSLLKLLNIYNPLIHNDGKVSKTGIWVELFRTQIDSQNQKVVSMTKILQKSKDNLDSGDSHTLFISGVTL